MKCNSKLNLFLALAGLVSTGCQTQFPTSYASSGANPAMIVDFESGLNVSASLAEANRPNNKIVTPGVITPNGSPLVTPLLVSGSGLGAANTNSCVQMQGTVIDPGNASYPAILLSIPIDTNGNGRYDASLFTGIRFYIKTAPGDTAGSRSFSIPIVKTSVAPAGTCATYNSCYNGFAQAYNNTGGAWTPVNIVLASMVRGNYGGAISPTTLSGTNLQEILGLQWSEGNQNVPGTVNVDFSVDEIQFY